MSMCSIVAAGQVDATLDGARQVASINQVVEWLEFAGNESFLLAGGGRQLAADWRLLRNEDTTP